MARTRGASFSNRKRALNDASPLFSHSFSNPLESLDMGGVSGVATNFETTIAQPIIEFADKTIDAWAICKGLASPWQTVSEKIAQAYDKYLFLGDTLQKDVPEPVPGKTPRFLFYATSLQTGVSVRIERKRLGDYRIGEIPNPDLSMGKIVSSAEIQF